MCEMLSQYGEASQLVKHSGGKTLHPTARKIPAVAHTKQREGGRGGGEGGRERERGTETETDTRVSLQAVTVMRKTEAKPSPAVSHKGGRARRNAATK